MKNTATPNSHPPITYIPNELLEVCELDTQHGVRMNASTGLLLMFNAVMTAGEMVDVITSLHEIADHLKSKLVQRCHICNNCEEKAEGSPKEWMDNCTLCHDLLNPELDIQVPDYLRKEAGIPLDAKLDAYSDEENGEITLCEAEHEYDISDVPEFLLKELVAAGACLPELDESLRMEYTIHAD
ncbi:hypothetical protein RFF05_04225 [Bengtsoniella intestinalis]|uniref:hypothetical protein n=1 Tax=Bengtsoniella intestinalis TaxID=3073143 RepID=UPI00391F8F51